MGRRRRSLNPLGAVIHLELVGDVPGGRFEFANALAQTSGDLWNTLGAKYQEYHQEYQGDFYWSEGSHGTTKLFCPLSPSLQKLTDPVPIEHTLPGSSQIMAQG